MKYADEVVEAAQSSAKYLDDVRARVKSGAKLVDGSDGKWVNGVIYDEINLVNLNDGQSVKLLDKDKAYDIEYRMPKIGTDFGKIGILVESPGTKVDWTLQTDHGAKRMTERGVTKDMVNSWVKDGLAFSQGGWNGRLFSYGDS